MHIKHPKLRNILIAWYSALFFVVIFCAVLVSAQRVSVDPSLKNAAKRSNDIAWQIQFNGAIDTNVNARVFDLDGETAEKSVVQTLRKKKAIVLCYVDVGSFEDWRSDAGVFPMDVIEKAYEGWPGERWLDIRQIGRIGPILQKRFDVCKEKGFDGIDPDNMNGYQTNTGFPLTYADQIIFNTWIANEAHARGLMVGLKNDEDQIADLLPFFDFAITEECANEGWCSAMTPFLSAKKPVFDIEYTDTRVTPHMFCREAKKYGITMIQKNRNLDAFRVACP